CARMPICDGYYDDYW
nr:immunoglobulin heavy chain junction region [Mus musculus]